MNFQLSLSAAAEIPSPTTRDEEEALVAAANCDPTPHALTILDSTAAASPAPPDEDDDHLNHSV